MLSFQLITKSLQFVLIGCSITSTTCVGYGTIVSNRIQENLHEKVSKNDSALIKNDKVSNKKSSDKNSETKKEIRKSARQKSEQLKVKLKNVNKKIDFEKPSKNLNWQPPKIEDHDYENQNRGKNYQKPELPPEMVAPSPILNEECPEYLAIYYTVQTGVENPLFSRCEKEVNYSGFENDPSLAVLKNNLGQKELGIVWQKNKLFEPGEYVFKTQYSGKFLISVDGEVVESKECPDKVELSEIKHHFLPAESSYLTYKFQTKPGGHGFFKAGYERLNSNLAIGEKGGSKVGESLQYRLENPDNENPEFKIRALLATQADVSEVNEILEVDQRFHFVKERLLQTAQESQSELNQKLQLLLEQGKILSFSSNFLPNAFSIELSDESAKEVVSFLENEDMIAWINSQVQFESSQVDDSLMSIDIKLSNDVDPWHLEQTYAKEVHQELGLKGKDVPVSIVEIRGINPNHPEIRSSFSGNGYDMNDGVLKDYNQEVFHGTGITSLIAGKNVGLAPDSSWSGFSACREKIVRTDFVENKVCQADMNDIFQRVFITGDRLLRVLNLSLGSVSTPTRPSNDQKINLSSLDYVYDLFYLTKAGTSVVVGAGNVSATPTPLDTIESPFEGRQIGSPGNYPFVFAVGSINKENRHSEFSSVGPGLPLYHPKNHINNIQVSPQDVLNNNLEKIFEEYDNYQKKPDLVTYGENVNVAYGPVTDKPEYLVKNEGTSISAPIVSGCLALIYEANPKLTPMQAHDALRRTAIDLGDKGWDIKHGYGALDCYAAVTSVMFDSGKLKECPKGKYRVDTFNPVEGQINMAEALPSFSYCSSADFEDKPKATSIRGGIIDQNNYGIKLSKTFSDPLSPGMYEINYQGNSAAQGKSSFFSVNNLEETFNWQTTENGTGQTELELCQPVEKITHEYLNSFNNNSATANLDFDFSEPKLLSSPKCSENDEKAKNNQGNPNSKDNGNQNKNPYSWNFDKPHSVCIRYEKVETKQNLWGSIRSTPLGSSQYCRILTGEVEFIREEDADFILEEGAKNINVGSEGDCTYKFKVVLQNTNYFLSTGPSKSLLFVFKDSKNSLIVTETTDSYHCPPEGAEEFVEHKIHNIDIQVTPVE